jgi:uncharacterized membrane protein YebE (DUF533 family)
MSLMKTLAKVAVGVAVAKGAKSMMQGRSGQSTAGGGLGGLLGQLTQGAQNPGTGRAMTGGGGLEDMLGGLLGGSQGQSQTGQSTGGLGDLLNQLGGAQGSGGGTAGGLQDMLGKLTQGGGAGSAGMGGLLGGLAGALQGKPQQNNNDFGSVLNSQFDQTPEPAIEPSAEQEMGAALMLSAMIQAAKSDGKFDDAEKEKLLGKLGDVSQEEAAFVQAEMAKPVSIDALVAEVPQGMGTQVYAMSVLGIDLDSQAEAQYLHQLAQKLGIDQKMVNHVHEQLGVPSLYS